MQYSLLSQSEGYVSVARNHALKHHVVEVYMIKLILITKLILSSC